MKTILLSLALAAPLVAQDLVPAFLINRDGIGRPVFIEAASEKTIRYRTEAQSLNRKDVRTSSVNIVFYTPPSFKEAKAAFDSRDYKTAREKFAATREQYRHVDDLKGNYSTLAGFYELECARKLEDYEGLEALLSKFQPGPLVHEHHKTQMSIYPLYNALRTEDWSRLLTLCDEFSGRELPGSLRAQIEYCRGLALEKQEQLDDALIAYNKAFVCDYAASEVIARNAALGCFRIYSAHPEVQLAQKLHGKPEENPNSNGAFLLAEAASLVSLWDKALGAGEPLPDDFKSFAKYAQ